VRNVYKISVRRHVVGDHLRPRHRWEDSIKMVFKEAEYEGVLIHLALGRDQCGRLL